MKMRLFFLATLAFAITRFVAHGEPSLAANAAGETTPLQPGSQVPPALVAGRDGVPVALQDSLAGRPTVLVFFRGSWCMYCNRQLEALKMIDPDLRRLGVQLIAISPDSVQNTVANAEKHQANYRLLSDSSMDAARAFGISFKVDEDTLLQYQGYGISLSAASGQAHHELPVPSVFLVDANGRIAFTYSNPDYTARLDPAELLSEARKLLEGAGAEPQD